MSQDYIKENTPGRIAFFQGATLAQKSSVVGLPSRSVISLDVLITGTASVSLYASNVESSATGTGWGAPMRTFTSSQKVLIEDEPWVYWMAEITAVNGSVSMVAGV